MVKQIFQETLCCNRKRCPVVTLLEDGSMTITDNDPEEGSVGKIVIKPDAVARLREILAEKR